MYYIHIVCRCAAAGAPHMPLYMQHMQQTLHCCTRHTCDCRLQCSATLHCRSAAAQERETCHSTLATHATLECSLRLRHAHLDSCLPHATRYCSVPLDEREACCCTLPLLQHMLLYTSPHIYTSTSTHNHYYQHTITLNAQIYQYVYTFTQVLYSATVLRYLHAPAPFPAPFFVLMLA